MFVLLGIVLLLGAVYFVEKGGGTIVNDFQLSKNFNMKEFQSPGTGEVKVDEKLVALLQKMRDITGKPVIITSGYRTVAYNNTLLDNGAIKDSNHTKGTAADIKIPGMSPSEVARLADEIGFDGIGTYKTFTHVDVGGKKLRWNG